MRPAQFAARLLRRFARRRAVRRALDLLLRARLLALPQRVLERRELHRVLSIVRAHRDRAVVVFPRSDALARIVPRQERAAAAMPLVGPRLLWRDLIERRRRIETRETRTVRAAALGAERDAPGSAVVPLTMSVAPRDVFANRTSDAMGQSARPAQFVPAVATARAAAPAGTAPVDVPSASAAPEKRESDIERLAERVIGTIDRRIAAHRERLGRA